MDGRQRLLRRCRVAAALACAFGWSATLGAQGVANEPAQTMTFEQALQYAVEHYPAVSAALEQVNASTANVSVARLAYLPRLETVWQTNRATTNNIVGQLLPQPLVPPLSGPALSATSSQTAWGAAAAGLLSWEPVDLGLRGASVREAEAAVTRARAEEGLTRLTVQNAVGSAFLAVVHARLACVAADADVQRRDVLARVAHTLVDNQLRPGAEASRADAEQAAAKTRAIQARETLALAQASLGRLLGISAGVVSVDDARLTAPTATVNSPLVPAPQHPLVQSEQAAVDLARAREGVLARTDRPRLFVQSSLSARGSGATADGRVAGGPEGLWPERVNWAAGLQVVFPNLFDFSSLRARRATAAALTGVEHARYDDAVLTVTSQQRAAQAMVDAALAIAQNTPIQLAAARQSEIQARARYDAGLANMTEVAEAQNLLAGAEYQDAAARVGVWRALLASAVAQGDLRSFIERLRAPEAP